MFKVTPIYNATSHSFKVNYQYYGKEEKEVSVFPENRKTAALECSKLAFDFLRISLEYFEETINSVKPHYFDQTAKPYIRNSFHFTTAFWKFLSIKEKTKSLHNQPLEFAKLIQRELPKIDGIIPDFVDLKRVEIRERMNDLIEVSKKLETYISRYQNNFFKIAS